MPSNPRVDKTVSPTTASPHEQLGQLPTAATTSFFLVSNSALVICFQFSTADYKHLSMSKYELELLL